MTASAEIREYYVVNLSHASRATPFITVWRPECKGYAWPLSWAGKYPEDEVLAHLDYYNGGDNVAVPCEVLDAMAVETPPGMVDNNAGPVVLSNKANWDTVLAAVILPPKRPCKPKYPTKRK